MWGATSCQDILVSYKRISIHAPMWGATCKNSSFNSLSNYFNPRTHVGCDALVTIRHAKSKLFQSTHPCGVRLNLAVIIFRTWYFNPRTHVGCDKMLMTSLVPKFYFNPRTHVGCDSRKAWPSNKTKYFNPRTHVGCDNYLCWRWTGWIYFNPRTHVGCDPTGDLDFDEFRIFQSTHPCGVRPYTNKK